MARVIPFNQQEHRQKRQAMETELSEYADEQTNHFTTGELFTVEEVRAIKGCEHFSDEEAKEVISTLDAFAQIIIDTMSNNGIIVGTTISIEPIQNITSEAA